MRWWDLPRLQLLARFIITLVVLVGAGAELHLQAGNQEISGGLLAIFGLVLGYWFGRSGNQ